MGNSHLQPHLQSYSIKVDDLIKEARVLLRDIIPENLTEYLYQTRDSLENEYHDMINNIPGYKKVIKPRKESDSNSTSVKEIPKYQLAVCGVNLEDQEKTLLIEFSYSDKTDKENSSKYEKYTVTELNSDLEYIRSYSCRFFDGRDDSDRFETTDIRRPIRVMEYENEKGTFILSRKRTGALHKQYELVNLSIPGESFTIFEFVQSSFQRFVKSDPDIKLDDWQFYACSSIILMHEAEDIIEKLNDKTSILKRLSKHEYKKHLNELCDDAKKLLYESMRIKYEYNGLPKNAQKIEKKQYSRYQKMKNANLKKPHPLKELTCAIASVLHKKSPRMDFKQISNILKGAIVVIAEKNAIKSESLSKISNPTIDNWIKSVLVKTFPRRSFDMFDE